VTSGHVVPTLILYISRMISCALEPLAKHCAQKRGEPCCQTGVVKTGVQCESMTMLHFGRSWGLIQMERCAQRVLCECCFTW